jgi:hypothetical protein
MLNKVLIPVKHHDVGLIFLKRTFTYIHLRCLHGEDERKLDDTTGRVLFGFFFLSSFFGVLNEKGK